MYTICKPLKLYCDNDSTRRFSLNNRVTSKSKSLEVKYIVLKENVQDQLVSIIGSPMSLMLADLLMKALAPKAYNEHVKNMGLKELPC